MFLRMTEGYSNPRARFFFTRHAAFRHVAGGSHPGQPAFTLSRYRDQVLDTAYCLAQTLAISLPTVIDAARGRLTRETCDERLAAWAEKLIARTDTRVTVHGPPVDWSRAYVIMSNHQSHFDLPIVCYVVRGTVRMVAKKELFRIPIFGRAMREAEMICIDRDDRASAIASLRAAGDLIADGVSVWIAPEGTRSKTGRLGPLKKGGFMLAHETGAPILPIAIAGTHAILPPGTAVVKRGKPVRVQLGEPLETEGVPVPDLMDKLTTFFEKYARNEAP
jgi:1-acyl-sn-glycerol-3-phosphate acyltransferase